ncbi:pentapeptide repeat-containing protein [Amycolatopsis sp. MEPSY49]|uniref:pentapeptide repeat-containing protein n=1 Tax=Amycolatopsis sp. MEPSY49 TaxID=3151600 RepID=UPI003EF5EA45
MDDDVTPGKVLSNRVIAWCAAGLVVVAAGIGWPLLSVYGLGLEAIRTVGTIVLGAGGAVGLLLAARRQQTAEQDLVEKRRDLAHKEHVQRHTEAVAAETLAHQQRISAATEADAAERRITELYAKAVEQLGSDKAAVRLGGLYALERLAQNNQAQRHTVINVLCAYLRMPYESGQEQEKHVRIAAQRILAQHLRPGSDSRSDADAFWPDVDLDLRGATLFEFQFQRCRVRSAQFTDAKFDGDADLGGTAFLERADFDRTTFTGSARFSDATFVKGARIRTAEFQGKARFRGTDFHEEARFTGTRFLGNAWLGGAGFRADVWFTQTHFEQDVRFEGAVFRGSARFHDATFAWPAERRQKMFRNVWIRPSSRSQWPPGWTPVAATDRPAPDPDGGWRELRYEEL